MRIALTSLMLLCTGCYISPPYKTDAEIQAAIRTGEVLAYNVVPAPGAAECLEIKYAANLPYDVFIATISKLHKDGSTWARADAWASSGRTLSSNGNTVTYELIFPLWPQPRTIIESTLNPEHGVKTWRVTAGSWQGWGTSRYIDRGDYVEVIERNNSPESYNLRRGEVVAHDKASYAAYRRIAEQYAANNRDKLTVTARRPPPTAPDTEKITGPIKRRWAIVIGVANYKHSGKNLQPLQYADKDAKAFSDFLTSEAGGSFPKSHVTLLTNDQATNKNIRKALFTFLKKAIKEDLVIVYFSGHGASDPDRPKNLYLLTYDTDPSDIAATAFPMDDVKKALANTIEAQRVVVLADACHSGGVASDVKTKGVRIGERNEAMVKYWSQLSKTSHGRVIFTSSQSGETSQESAKWGKGHGVFTWALLEGLKGAADSDGNGIVTIGEAIRYTDEKVRRETKSAQHPTVAGDKYDSNLPMGVVK